MLFCDFHTIFLLASWSLSFHNPSCLNARETEPITTAMEMTINLLFFISLSGDEAFF